MNKTEELLLLKDLNGEIADYEALFEAMGGVILGNNDDLDVDMKVIKSRLSGLKDARDMIIKASIEIEGVDNMLLMTMRQKKIFLKLVRIILWFRR